jgi:hypothetical protein
MSGSGLLIDDLALLEDLGLPTRVAIIRRNEADPAVLVRRVVPGDE